MVPRRVMEEELHRLQQALVCSPAPPQPSLRPRPLSVPPPCLARPAPPSPSHPRRRSRSSQSAASESSVGSESCAVSECEIRVSLPDPSQRSRSESFTGSESETRAGRHVVKVGAAAPAAGRPAGREARSESVAHCTERAYPSLSPTATRDLRGWARAGPGRLCCGGWIREERAGRAAGGGGWSPGPGVRLASWPGRAAGGVGGWCAAYGAACAVASAGVRVARAEAWVRSSESRRERPKPPVRPGSGSVTRVRVAGRGVACVGNEEALSAAT